MSTLDILGNTSEQADSIRLMLKVRGMKDGRFIDADPLIILKADNHQGSDRWDVYVSKTVYPTAESYGTLAGILRMRTVRGGTRQNQRLPIARRMGWREQEQKKESK